MPELEGKTESDLRNSSWFAKWLVVMHIQYMQLQGKHAGTTDTYPPICTYTTIYIKEMLI